MDQNTEDSIAVMMLIGIIGMLILAIALIFFFVLYQRRLMTQQQHIKEIKIAHQRASLESFILAQEAERKRIAQDLHDGIGALLSASKMYINRLPAGENVPKEIAFIKQETGGLINETIDNIRSITRNLLPTNLERFGLIAAVEDLCKRINDIGTIQMNFYFNQDKRFEVQQEFALYRILQELTNNTLKYAEASQVDININLFDQNLKLLYRDNGKGFEIIKWQDNPQVQKGLGLRGIRSRADVLEAELVMESTPGNGFFVSLEMKTKPPEND